MLQQIGLLCRAFFGELHGKVGRDGHVLGIAGELQAEGGFAGTRIVGDPHGAMTKHPSAALAQL
jgi:hypothetical protein